MAVTIQDGIVDADIGNAPRAIAATADGTLWAAVFSNLATDRWEFWYSTNGVSWTENTSLRITGISPNAPFAFAINTVNDIAVFRKDDGNVQSIYGLTTSSTTWADGSASSDITTAQFCDMVVFDKPGSSNFFVATMYDAGTGDQLDVSEFTSAGTFVLSEAYYVGAADGTSSLDFNHTGDGNTVAGSAPHLYVGYRQVTLTRPYFRKYTYSGGSWSAGSERQLSADAADDGVVSSLVFDGARAIMAFADSNDVQVFERDAADTTTTDRSSAVPAMPGSAVSGVRVSANGTTGFDLYNLDVTDDDIDYVTYDRSGGSWGSWTEFANYASGLTAACWSVSKHKVGSLVPSVWLVDDGTNYDLETANRTYNVAPSAPTWLTPSDGTAQDETATLAITWQFNDPDGPSDTQSAYALKRVISAVTTYYRASDQTWQATEQKVTSSTSGVTLPATWGADGESVALSVRTWDAADVIGPYGSTLTVLGSTPVTPSITAPATNATVTGPTPTITWTATEQTARRIRWLSSADAVLYDSGKVTTTVKSLTSPYSLANGTVDAKLEVTVWNDDDLAGAPDTNTGIDVTFTPPVTPTLAVTAVPASGHISVAVTNPAGGGGEPAVVENDVWVRVAAGGTQVGERTVNDDGIRIATGVAEDGTYLDYAAASGIDFEYRVRGIAASGVDAWSAWT